ncbi:FKBP12-associated protein, partial [Rhizopus stolonifer]
MSGGENTGVTEVNTQPSNTPVSNRGSSSSKPRKPKKDNSKKQQEEGGEHTTENTTQKKRRPRQWKKKKKTDAPLEESKTEETKSEQTGDQTDAPAEENKNNDQAEKKKRKRKPKAPKQAENGEAKLQPSHFKNRAQGQLTLDDDDKKNDKQSKKNKQKQKRPAVEPLPFKEHDMATKLIHELKSSTYECMICMDTVRSAHHVWGCDCCWAVFHLNCIQSWASFSCDITCNELLGCGKHRCKEKCHAGLCPPCTLQEDQSCYCGKDERETRCGNGKQVQVGEHVGNYSCEKKCDSLYECKKHTCEKPCHPCSANTQPCPFDPSAVKTCPCGSRSVLDLSQNQERTACTDPIPTCESHCNKTLPCGHNCQTKCHLGQCPPCEVSVQVSCRCQANKFEKICSEVCEAAGGESPLCNRVCKAGRNCGRHQCGAVCCPAAKTNGKSRKGTEFLHDCPNTCNKTLSCGTHQCQEKCHKGKCPPCLEATFDDVTCHCTRTRLEPPVRCGTKLPNCPHPCVRPNPCGHVRFLNHNCHPDEEPCPPCPVLVARNCLCGKTELKNVPCYRESPRCGRPCEKPLPCRKHLCPKTCHNGLCLTEDETCTQYCNDSRSCGHPCKERCHDDSPCPEKEPCAIRVKASCKCGQNTMEIPCNATAESTGSKKLLECNDFCAKVLRNRRLAMALDIKRDDYGTPSLSVDDLGYYDDSLRDFYNENRAWCRSMEMSLIELARDTAKKTSHLRPMKSEYRQFIHRYAVHFNIATEAIDAEPKRSVILRKTLGPCRIPPILLSKAIANPALNRPPQNLEAALAGDVPKTTKQPVNAIYLSDMSFGLTKIELDAELVPLLKLGEDSVPFESTWVNENDAVVVPSINDAISMDEKETIVWHLKKVIKSAFVSEEDSKKKASRVDCCWVNQKGEITWSEKQLSKNN